MPTVLVAVRESRNLQAGKQWDLAIAPVSKPDQPHAVAGSAYDDETTSPSWEPEIEVALDEPAHDSIRVTLRANDADLGSADASLDDLTRDAWNDVWLTLSNNAGELRVFLNPVDFGTAAASPAKTDKTDESYEDDLDSPEKKDDAADPSPEDDQNKDAANKPADANSPTSNNNNNSSIRNRKGLPPRSVATVTYPNQRNVAVADILDPSKPLVKSTQPLTKPLGPSFVEETTAEERRQRRLQNKSAASDRTANITEQRNNERKYLKAQQEFEREKRLAERAIYHRERVAQWATRLSSSPLGVDLVADHERIDEDAFVRQREEKRRRALAERRKRRIKNEIIVKALAEVPLLEEARRQKREMLEEERREKALRDVQRVEAIQARKLRDIALMQEERQAKLDQRLMNA